MRVYPRLPIEEVVKLKPERSRLTPVSYSFDRRTYGQNLKYLNCVCDCGMGVIVDYHKFKDGVIPSCGCLRSEITTRNKTKYPGNIEKINSLYTGMIRRCYNPKCKEYRYYGGCGVTVCDEWKNDYVSFLNWAKENGWAPGLELDKDKAGGKIYSPETCQFVTRKENCRNRRSNLKFEYQGALRTLTEICEMAGLKFEMVRDRIQTQKLDLHTALTKPVKAIGVCKP